MGQESGLLWAKQLGKWSILSYSMRRKALMWAGAWFSHLPKPPHLCGARGPDRPGQVAIRTYLWVLRTSQQTMKWVHFTQWDANDQCYNNITSCHHQLCILKKEEKWGFCHFLILSLRSFRINTVLHFHFSVKGSCVTAQLVKLIPHFLIHSIWWAAFMPIMPIVWKVASDPSARC